jgi:peptidoglycan/LPS O-acetylase OafA/YrhL
VINPLLRNTQGCFAIAKLLFVEVGMSTADQNETQFTPSLAAPLPQEHRGGVPTQRAESGVLGGVQILRGLCAMLVVLSHENGFLGFPDVFSARPMPALIDAAAFAVAVFFAISGFIIVASSLDDHWQPRLSAADYARRRAIRILPFFWLCTVGYNLLSWAGTGRVKWVAIVSTLLLSPVGELRPNVAWSLRHELLFYLLFAFAFLRRSRRPLPLLLWFASPLLLAVPIVAFEHSAPAGSLSAEALRVIFLGSENGANLQFAVGFAIGLAWVKARSPAGGLRHGPLLCTLLFAAASAAIILWPLPPGVAQQLLWSVTAGGVLWSAILAKVGDSLAARVGMLFGNASFSIYLTHNPVMLIILAATKRLHFVARTEMQLAVYLGFCVLVSAAVGIIVHLAVERPLIRLLIKRFRSRHGHPPLHAAMQPVIPAQS